MDTHTLLELFGYIGSAMVIISMLMSSIIKLRIINTIGSVISGIYALICSAIPLALMNLCLVIINIWGLYKLLKSKKDYELVKANSDDSMVKFFLERNLDDIKSFFPSFDISTISDKLAYVVCYDGTPAGVMIGKLSDDVFDIDLDYSTPAYRDCSVGEYLYTKLSGTEIKSLIFSKELSDAHSDYLTKMGFDKTGDVFERKI